MNEIHPNWYETDGAFPFAGSSFQTRAFLLVRPKGNLWVYSSGQVEAHAEFIRGKGGIKKQFLSHSDEAGSFCDRTRELFGAPLTCPEQEKEIVSTQCQVDETFNEDGELESGFEIIMTPGVIRSAAHATSGIRPRGTSFSRATTFHLTRKGSGGLYWFTKCRMCGM